jgi:hypothetical protein
VAFDIKTLWESTIGKGIAALVGLSTIIGAFVTINNYIATDSELAATEKTLSDKMKASEGRIISEVRTESAETRFVLIEDMEFRLDSYDYEISIIQAKGDIVPEALIINRNNLERRIQRLKNNESSTDDDIN